MVEARGPRRDRRVQGVAPADACTSAARPVATYDIDLGFNWTADKLHEGDGATPEGRYRVVARLGKQASIYYKALLLDYPNAGDRAEFARARRSGELPVWCENRRVD